LREEAEVVIDQPVVAVLVVIGQVLEHLVVAHLLSQH